LSPERHADLDAIPAGGRGVIRLPTDSSQDHEPALAVHVIRGSRTGPSLALVATAHGDEWGSIEPIRRLLGELDPSALRGRVLAVPVAQPRALSSGSRNAPGEPDHNRVLPGGEGSATERLVETLTRDVLAGSDAVLDFHGGGWAQLLGCITYGNDYPNAGTTDACKAMARAFGWPYLRATPAARAYPGPGSVLGWVGGTLGRPVAMVNLGGAGFGAEWDERWTLAQLRGLRNTLRHLEMLPGRLELPARFLHFSTYREVVAPAAGLLRPRVGTDHLGGRFEAGEPLGDLWDAESLDGIATLSSPCRGVLYSLRGSGPVAAETACFALADLDAPGTIWENAT
jgi:predicted deacylase